MDETAVVITVNGHGTEMTFENLRLNKLTHHKLYNKTFQTTNCRGMFLLTSYRDYTNKKVMLR